MKKYGPIRNRQAYDAKLDKAQGLLNKQRDIALENLLTVLRRQFGDSLNVRSREEAALRLIRGGILGGSLKSARRTGAAFKQHEQTGEPIGKFNQRGCREAVIIVKEALDTLEREGQLIIEYDPATDEIAVKPTCTAMSAA